ncbi:MAG: hypothetical protein OEW30_21215 [Acidimicrobiia bacterium]|nr:hypothetical protein [Acidimicrobiia bacterium]
MWLAMWAALAPMTLALMGSVVLARRAPATWAVAPLVLVSLTVPHLAADLTQDTIVRAMEKQISTSVMRRRRRG